MNIVDYPDSGDEPERKMFMKQLKKLCLTAVCCGMLLGITAMSVSAANTYVRGDANGDGEVTVADVTLIQRKLLGVSTGYFDTDAANIDKKGGVSLSDAVQIQRYIVGCGSNPYYIGALVDRYELPIIFIE